MASLTSNATGLGENLVPDEVAGSLLAQVFRNTSGWTIFFTLLSLAVVYDQALYIYRKGSIAGPSWKIPFMGAFIASVNPKFHEYLDKWASGDLTCVSVFHKFVVIACSRDMARKVFNSPAYCKPCVVPIAEKLLRPDNWVFLDGQAHVAYRKGLNTLFTRQALDTYLPHQQEVYRTYFDRFVKISQEDNKGQHIPFMPWFRELMCALSCRTFVGHYISDDAIKKIADNYYRVTAALELVNFPIILPFTKPWYGKKAADLVLDEFSKCAAKAKVRMRAGGDVTCLLDAWVQLMLQSERYNERKEKGLAADEEKPSTVVKMFTDLEISMTLFTFLFASQDATSSACTWLFQLMADNPDMLDRVRADTLSAMNGQPDTPLSIDLLEKMTYTKAVVKETLRYRPPVIMVPYLVKKSFAVTPDFTAPKDAVIVPSVYPSLHDPEVYPNPEIFDPERWITGTAEAQGKNWLVFGTGPHYCLGQTYAQMNLIALIGMASLNLDWNHRVTHESEIIKVFCTLFPQDDCLLTFKKRTTRA